RDQWTGEPTRSWKWKHSYIPPPPVPLPPETWAETFERMGNIIGEGVATMMTGELSPTPEQIDAASIGWIENFGIIPWTGGGSLGQFAYTGSLVSPPTVTASTLDPARSHARKGAAATADGFIPFFDPFADFGWYDPCDPILHWSQTLGGIS